jgi:trans-2,3-dihydro-3-hydroxyanthranilate isomerase
VVHDADGVDDDTMGAFARETRLPETTFVQSSTEEGADYRNRIWTVAGEVPFAGHPSLGTAVAFAQSLGRSDGSFVQQTEAGLQPIDVRRDGDRWHASMLQEPATFGDEVDPDRALGALGLTGSDAHPDLPPQVVGTGLDHLLVPLGDPGALDRARPDAAWLRELLGQAGCVCAYLAVPEHDGERAQARSFFIEASRAVEDPATGSAAGPLMAYLSARTGAGRLTVDQGVAMGRASELRCEAGERVRVGGDAVVILEGRLEL